jgi:YbbR domain-containing protein
MTDVLNKWREWLKNNLTLKILSLVVAILSFYAIHGAISFTWPFEIPVEVRVEKGIAIHDQNPRTVEVVFRGAREDLSRLGYRKVRLVAKPKASDPTGTEVLNLNESQIEGAGGVRVVSIRPKHLTLTFDRETQRTFPIAKPDITGKPRIGRVEMEFEPKTATVVGPQRRLDKVTVLDTEPVDVEGLIESFTRKVRILQPPDTMVSIDPPEIDVRVNIVTESVSREWTNITVNALSASENPLHVQLKPSNVNVQVHGRKDLVTAIHDTAITPFVDCRTLAPDSSTDLPVLIHTQHGIELFFTITPEKITAVTGPGTAVQ